MSRVTFLIALALVVTSTAVAHAQVGSSGALGPTVLKLPDGPASVAGLADPASMNVFSGQVGYSIPIKVPSAGGMSPSLALSYSGALGNGVMGIGWSLEIAAIHRSLREGVPTYTDADELVLEGIGGGGRLVRVDTGAYAGEYRVEGKGNSVRVQRVGSRFVVTDPDGVVYFLGTTPAARQEDGNGHIAAWFLTEVKNTSSESLFMRYRLAEGQVYLDTVEWGPGRRFRLECTYETRADRVVSYATGFEVVTGLRLASLRGSMQGTETRTYHLGYEDEVDPGDGDVRLSRLREVRATGRAGDGELPVVHFTYARGEAASPHPLTGTDEAGDHANLSGWVLDQRGVTFADVDGDGVDDLLRLEMGNHEWRKNRGGKFDEARPLAGAPAIDLEHSRLVDVDGDARPELVRIVDDSWRVYRLVDGQWVGGGGWRGTQGVPLADGNGVALADVNGDGRADVIEAVTGGLRIRRGGPTGLSPPFMVGPISTSDPNVEPGRPGVRLLDWNGDSIVDVVWITDGWMKVFLGRGDGTFEVHDRIFYPWGVGAFDQRDLHLVDLNRDGLVDLVRLVAGSVLWYAGTGDHRFRKTPRHIARPESTDSDIKVTVADADGNGSLDLVWSSPRQSWALDFAGPTSAGMLETIDNGLGQTTRFVYQASGLLAVEAESAGTPWTRKLPISIPVPVQMTTSLADGAPSRSVYYGLRDGFWDGVERRFGGFLEARIAAASTDPGNSRIEITRFAAGEGADRNLRGMANYARVENGLGKVFTQTESSLETRAIAGLPDVPLLRCGVTTQVMSSTFEGAATPVVTRTTTTFDDQCRAKEGHEEGRLDRTGDERTVVRRYQSDETRWVRDRVVEEKVLSATGALVSLTDYRFGDEGGTYAQDVVGKGWPAATYGWLVTGPGQGRFVLESERRYDGAGNVIESFEDGVRSTIQWSVDGLYPLRESVHPTAGMTLTWSMTWDPVLGEPLVLTDANGDTITAGYDSLGRVESLARNGNPPHQRFAYDWSGPRSHTTTYTFDGPAQDLAGKADQWTAGAPWRESIAVVNGAGEGLYSAVRTSPGSWIVSGWKERDARGRVVAVTDPFYWNSAALPTARPGADVVSVQTVQYDALDRPVLQVLATGAQQVSTYAPFCRTIGKDALDPVTSCSDGLGRIVHTERTVSGVLESVDALYDAEDHVLAMCLQGPCGQSGVLTHSFGFDSLGRLRTASDPDIGPRTMEYDDAGHLISFANGVGQTTTLAYDGVGRLLSKTGADGIAFTYHYDQRYGGAVDGHVLGRLGWVEEPTGRAELVYDELGHIVQSTRNIDGVSEIETRVYSPSGTVLRESHDDGFALDYSYDAAGRVVSIGSYWQAVELDAAGRVKQERFGNGLSTHVEYDAIGQSRHLRLERPSGNPLYDVILTRNPYGAVTQVADSDGVGLDHSATFTYDGAARLVQSSMGTGAAAYTFTFQYDPLQNMIARTATGPSDLGLLTGTYTYGENGAGPRQLTSITAPVRMRVATVAGGGQTLGDGVPAAQAKLTTPGRLARLAAGDLVVAEAGTSKLRRVSAASILSTFAGTGTAGFAGDGGAATAARLNQPVGVSLGLDGQTLYVADTVNHRIRKIAPGGTITTIAGTGTAGFSGDSGAATAAALNAPRDVVEAPGGVLYVADSGNGRIRKIVGGTITTVAGSGLVNGPRQDGPALATSLANPSGIALGPDGTLYIADTGNHRVRKLVGSMLVTVAGAGSAGFSGEGSSALIAQLNAPADVAVSTSGVLYIADTGNHRVRRVLGGNIFTVAGNGVAASTGDGGLATGASLNAPVALELTTSGALYVTESGGNRVRLLTPEQPLRTATYDHAGRQLTDASTSMYYNGLDQLVRVEIGGPTSAVRYAYGFDGERVRTQNPDGQLEYWFSERVHARGGDREHYVTLGNRLLARVTWRPPAAGAAQAAPVDLRPIAWVLLGGMLLGLLALLAPRDVRLRPRRGARLASLLVLTMLAPSCGLLGENQAALWNATETIYFHAGYGPGPVLLTRADGSVLEERRHEPFGSPIDAYREAAGGGGGTVSSVNYALDPFNALGKPTDPNTGWSFHGARWMSPQTARWLSPDQMVKAPNASMMATPWSLHPYAYVGQSPTLFWDPTGKLAESEPDVLTEEIEARVGNQEGFATGTPTGDPVHHPGSTWGLMPVPTGVDSEHPHGMGWLWIEVPNSQLGDYVIGQTQLAGGRTATTLRTKLRVRTAQEDDRKVNQQYTFLHGTSIDNANDIVAHGLKPVSTNTAPYPRGSFFTFSEGTPLALIAASHMGMRVAKSGNNLAVVKMTVPATTMGIIVANKWIRESDVAGTNGFPPQSVFLPEALPLLNATAKFERVAPEL